MTLSDVSAPFFFEGYDVRTAAGAPGSDVRGDTLNDKESLELLRSHYAIGKSKRRRLFDLARVLSEG